MLGLIWFIVCRWRYLAASAPDFIFQQGNTCFSGVGLAYNFIASGSRRTRFPRLKYVDGVYEWNPKVILGCDRDSSSPIDLNPERWNAQRASQRKRCSIHECRFGLVLTWVFSEAVMFCFCFFFSPCPKTFCCGACEVGTSLSWEQMVAHEQSALHACIPPHRQLLCCICRPNAHARGTSAAFECGCVNSCPFWEKGPAGI